MPSMSLYCVNFLDRHREIEAIDFACVMKFDIRFPSVHRWNFARADGVSATHDWRGSMRWREARR